MSDLYPGSVPITVAIVSTNHLVRIGLQAALSGQHHIRLVGEAGGALDTETLIARERPHVLVVDRETEVDIKALVRTVKTAVQTTRIILLSSIEDHALTVESISSGIDGIVLTIQPAAVLLATINHVCRLPAAMSVYECNDGSPPEGAVERSVNDSRQYVSTTFPGISLTDREEKIILLIGQALSNKDIAERLCISSITVRHHLTSIFGKFEVNSRQQLLMRAHDCGLLKLRAHH